MWDMPNFAALLRGLSALGRLVYFDKRGTGCSDRMLGTGSAEDRMDDARAVADAAGIDEAVVIGVSEGGPLAILFAAAFPERVRSLVLWGTFARALRAPDYPVGANPESAERFVTHIRDQ
jgi:pimeloyl-ACP methyl ester carboxylesterase